MPSKHSAQNQPTPAADSSTQAMTAAPASAAAADAAVASSEVIATGEQPQRKKKRKKRKLPPPHQRRMVQAIGRIEGCIKPAGNGIEIVTADNAAFRVSSVGKSGFALRLLGLSDSERCGRFGFWPAFYKEGIILVSFNNAEDWTPHENSPPVDQMFVCGTLEEVSSDHFSVLIGYGYKQPGERVGRVLRVESKPLPEWEVGTWVDLILRRVGEQWQWQGEFHPRGPQVGDGYKSWLLYKEGAEASEAQAQGEGEA